LNQYGMMQPLLLLLLLLLLMMMLNYEDFLASAF
jgi:hypothetical protein